MNAMIVSCRIGFVILNKGKDTKIHIYFKGSPEAEATPIIECACKTPHQTPLHKI